MNARTVAERVGAAVGLEVDEIRTVRVDVSLDGEAMVYVDRRGPLLATSTFHYHRGTP